MTLPPSEHVVNMVPTSRRPRQTSFIRAHRAGHHTLDPIRALTMPSGGTGLALSFQTPRTSAPQAWKRPGAEWPGELIHRCLVALPELVHALDRLVAVWESDVPWRHPLTPRRHRGWRPPSAPPGAAT